MTKSDLLGGGVVRSLASVVVAASSALLATHLEQLGFLCMAGFKYDRAIA